MEEFKPIEIKLLGKDILIHEHQVKNNYHLGGLDFIVSPIFYVNPNVGIFGRIEHFIFNIQTRSDDKKIGISHMISYREFHYLLDNKKLDETVLCLLFSEEYAKVILKQIT